MAPLNVGLMGYGFSTKSFHLPFIIPNPDLKVYAFLQRAEKPNDAKEAGKHCAIDYPEAKHYRTADEFFADPNIDLVVVCTHHDSHADFAERALNAGKHAAQVVVEKPFTVSIPEADHVIALAKEKGKILTVFQNRRYDSDFLTLQHLVDSGAFGKITEAEMHYDVDFPSWISGWNSPDYEPGNGMLFGLGSHTIDQALQLFGKPKSVTAFYRSLRGVESKTDDTFTIILQYGGEQKNLMVTIKTTVVSPMQYPLKWLVRGYKGSYVKYGDDPQESQVSTGRSATDPSFGVEKDAIHGLLTTSERFDKCQTKDEGSGRWVGKYPSLKGDYVGFYKDLVAAIHGKGEVKIKPEQSRDGIKIIELARESADKGITLPFEG
ncbi:hypothetical protein H2203_006675 [Taxawa tesnikishii (nom. ined.)]|nr:hypothetical protein H2203_006675 [Dothideales sp. JES 119]